MRFLDVTLDALEDPAMQFTTQPQVSGTEGGHTLSLQYLAQRGITLLGRLRDIEDGFFDIDGHFFGKDELLYFHGLAPLIRWLCLSIWRLEI